MEKCTPDIRAHFERYKSTIEAIRIRLSTEVATTINGSITYRNFNKLSKVFKEFEKMCEDWSIECANMSELSNKVIAAFRLRDNIKRYTDFLIRLNFDVPPVYKHTHKHTYTNILQKSFFSLHFVLFI